MAEYIRNILTAALVTGIVQIGLCQDCQVGESTGNDTRQIQNAFNSCAKVTMKKGEVYRSGTLELRSNTEWVLNGATVETINDINEFHRVGSYSRPVFIGAKRGTKNVKIVGTGNRENNVIKRATDFPLAVIHIDGIDGFLVRSIFLDSRESPAGTNDKPNGGFHINTGGNSSNIEIEDVMIKGNTRKGNVGTDGIHIQSSKNIKIRNCDIDVWDDGLAISANKPSEPVDNYLVDGCKITSKIRFGRGLDGDISNVTIRNVIVDQSKRRSVHGINFMIGGRGHEATGNLKNILLENITLIDTEQPIQHHGYLPGTWVGRSDNIVFKNITIKGSAQKASTFFGMDRLTLNNISSEQSIGFNLKDVCGVSLFKLSNVQTNLGDSITNVVRNGDKPVCSDRSTQRSKLLPPKGVRVNEIAQ